MATSTSVNRKLDCKLLPSNLYYRSTHLSRSIYFFDRFSTHLTRDSLQFNLYPQIVSPHSTRITSLDIDNTSESRFLLCGSQDCTISVYDLSTLGSDHHLNPDLATLDCSKRNNEHHLQWKHKNRFRPIARSQRNFAGENHLDPLFVPYGHSHSITQVQWYPVDTGVFLSSDTMGNILLWDTNTFTPVSCVKKTLMDSSMNVANPCAIASMDLPKLTNSTHLLLAIGSIQSGRSRHCEHGSASSSRLHIDDRVVYLCDIKSGSMTHQLSGHGMGGISCVQWSPVHDYILASGSRDGTIKLWDIRKSGSTACIVTLDRENKTKNEVYFSSIQQGSNDDGNNTPTITRMKKRRKKASIVGPGDYSQVECSSYTQSHAGPLSSLKFTPDGNYIVSASPTDGLKLWDVQSGKQFGTLLPTRYLGPSASCPNPLDRMQRTVPMQITQPGSFKSATIWIGGKNTKLFGYAIHGNGGKPNKVLSGHLDGVSAIASQDSHGRLFSGGKDGMVLGFGNKNEFQPDVGEAELNSLRGI